MSLIENNGEMNSAVPLQLSFLVSGREIVADRQLMSELSPYFRSLLSGSLKESRQVKIEITDIDADCLQTFVDFESGRQIDFWSLTDAEISKLLVEAEKFQIDAFIDKAIAEIVIISAVGDSQRWLQLAKNVGCVELESALSPRHKWLEAVQRCESDAVRLMVAKQFVNSSPLPIRFGQLFLLSEKVAPKQPVLAIIAESGLALHYQRILSYPDDVVLALLHNDRHYLSRQLLFFYLFDDIERHSTLVLRMLRADLMHPTEMRDWILFEMMEKLESLEPFAKQASDQELVMAVWHRLWFELKARPTMERRDAGIGAICGYPLFEKVVERVDGVEREWFRFDVQRSIDLNLGTAVWPSAARSISISYNIVLATEEPIRVDHEIAFYTAREGDRQRYLAHHRIVEMDVEKVVQQNICSYSRGRGKQSFTSLHARVMLLDSRPINSIVFEVRPQNEATKGLIELQVWRWNFSTLQPMQEKTT